MGRLNTGAVARKGDQRHSRETPRLAGPPVGWLRHSPSPDSLPTEVRGRFVAMSESAGLPPQCRRAGGRIRTWSKHF